MKSIQEVHFIKRGDARGSLVAIEGNQDIPFDIKRIFYVFGADRESVRGKHANKKSEFVMICLSGSCKVKVTVANGDATEYELSSPDVGLYLPKMTWKDMYDFSEDAVLLCLSNEHYDSEEYIRDYDAFLNGTYEQ